MSGMNGFKNNIGGWCKFLLVEGKLSDKEIIAFVRQKFVGAQTSTNSIAFYKNKLRDEGLLENRERVETLSVEEMRQQMIA